MNSNKLTYTATWRTIKFASPLLTIYTKITMGLRSFALLYCWNYSLDIKSLEFWHGCDIGLLFIYIFDEHYRNQVFRRTRRSSSKPKIAPLWRIFPGTFVYKSLPFTGEVIGFRQNQWHHITNRNVGPWQVNKLNRPSIFLFLLVPLGFLGSNIYSDFLV